MGIHPAIGHSSKKNDDFRQFGRLKMGSRCCMITAHWWVNLMDLSSRLRVLLPPESVATEAVPHLLAEDQTLT